MYAVHLNTPPAAASGTKYWFSVFDQPRVPTDIGGKAAPGTTSLHRRSAGDSGLSKSVFIVISPFDLGSGTLAARLAGRFFDRRPVFADEL
jgi:hypothetical protein